jgi:hypothetical protein
LKLTSLFVTDSLNALTRFQASGAKNTKFLALMEITDKKINEKFAKSSNHLIDVSEFIPEANEMVRKFYSTDYLAFIRDLLSHLSKEELLDVVFLDFTERSPFKGSLANQLYLLSLTHLVTIKYNSKLVSAEFEDKSLNNLVLEKPHVLIPTKNTYSKYLLQVLRFFILNFVFPKILGLLKKSKNTITNCFFTIYPYWWLDSYTGDPEERFFPKINEQTTESKSGYLVWLEDSFLSIWTRRHLIRSFQERNDVKFLNSYISLRDFAPLISFRKLSTFRKLLGSEIKETDLRIGTFDVSRLVWQDIARSLSEGEFVRSKLVNSAIKRYVDDSQPATLVFRYENQPIDRAVINGAGQGTKSVGYWHTSLSQCENYMSLWNILDLEKIFSMNEIANSVWPSHILYPNTICRESILREGYPADLMYQIELTRHQKVIDLYLAQIAAATDPVDKSKQRHKAIVVALTADKISSVLMLSATMIACRDLKELEILVKPHPAWSFDLEEFQLTHKGLGSTELVIVKNDNNIFRILQESDLLITSGTQMAFEGMLLGVMPIIYEPKYRFNPTNFDSFSDICFRTDSDIELGKFVRLNLENDAIIASKKMLWPNFLNSFFNLEEVKDSQKTLYSALNQINSSN